MLIWRAIIIINTVLGVPYYKYAKKGGEAAYVIFMSLCSALDACFVAGVRALRAGCRRAEDASSIAPVICGPLFFRIGVCWLFVYTQSSNQEPPK